MRSKTLVLTAVAALATGSFVAAQSAAGKTAAAKATLIGADELKWVDVPNTPVKLAIVKGDSAKGAHVSFMKLPAGFSAPLHSHSADHHAAVVSGTLVLTPEGGTAKSLGPGSWFEFTGKKKHLTACQPGTDCVLFLVSDGAWDLVPADAPKAEPKM
jgi:quercetin dioxygenase-like cupin family protein